MIRKIITHIKDLAQGKTDGTKRSSKWPSVRKAHLDTHPTCAVCGGNKTLEVHHIVPFHFDQSKELDPSNLITLCESKKHGLCCHLLVGHKGNYKNQNPLVVQDAAYVTKILSK